MILSRLPAIFPPLRAATGRGRAASGHPLRSHCLLLVLLLLALPLQHSLHVLSHAPHSVALHDAVAASAEGASAVAAGQEAMLGAGAMAGPAAGYGAEEGFPPGAALGFEQGAENGAPGHGAERSPEHGSGLLHQCDQCSGGPLAPGAAFNLAAAQPLSSPPALVGHSLLDRRTTAVYRSRAPPRS
ncbi:MAG: hypothetical protein Q8J78_05290 [Moraxellaceae bacterium]|nr:hypothetical protein [Moraxellaceae bacterium]